jgi:hypothetical protein
MRDENINVTLRAFEPVQVSSRQLCNQGTGPRSIAAWQASFRSYSSRVDGVLMMRRNTHGEPGLRQNSKNIFRPEGGPAFGSAGLK